MTQNDSQNLKSKRVGKWGPGLRSAPFLATIQRSEPDGAADGAGGAVAQVVPVNHDGDFIAEAVAAGVSSPTALCGTADDAGVGDMGGAVAREGSRGGGGEETEGEEGFHGGWIAILLAIQGEPGGPEACFQQTHRRAVGFDCGKWGKFPQGERAADFTSGGPACSG